MSVPVHECDDPAICPPCQDAARRPLSGWPPDRDEWSAPFLAMFAGRCDGCVGQIAPGDSIRRHVDDGDVRHDRAECLDDV